MTSRYHGPFLDDNKTSDDGDGKENEKKNAKNNMFVLANNNFARAMHVILYISLPSLHHYDMKRPNFTSLLYGGRSTQHKNCRFPFLNLDNYRLIWSQRKDLPN